MYQRSIKLLLRSSLSFSFLSAVADRFGWWHINYSVWGNWDNFVAYTKLINPWLSESLVEPVAILATVSEILFALCLAVGFKTELFAKLSGILLLSFGLAMTFSTGIKGAFDYSVFSAAAAAFALALLKDKYFEIDTLIFGKK